MSTTSLIQPDRELFSYKPYWAECYGTAPFLPMSREEMDQLGWDSCDVIIISGDAYVDHPSFGMAIIGRMLEAQGFRVGIIAQPDWSNKEDFMRLGKPNLFFGITAGNMDSMINRYTADRKLRHDDAYTAGNVGGKRPDRATLVYSQRCKEAYKDVPIVLGGIEASLRRIAHYDYWSDTVRRSVLVDSKADMLIYGNGERPLVEVAHRLAAGEKISEIHDIRNTAVMRKGALPGWTGVDSTRLDKPGRIEPIPNPYGDDLPCADGGKPEPEAKPVTVRAAKPKPWEKTYVLLPSFEKVKADKVLYAHTSRILHHETNPGFTLLVNAWCRYQTLATAADQMLHTHLFQRGADHRPVGRVVITQQRFMQATLAIALRYHHIFTLVTHSAQRVFTAVIHGGGVSHR